MVEGLSGCVHLLPEAGEAEADGGVSEMEFRDENKSQNGRVADAKQNERLRLHSETAAAGQLLLIRSN